MPSTPRRELVTLRRELYRRQQQLIRMTVAGYPADFPAYERAYLRRVRRFQRVARYDEVLEALERADVAYVGDYHTLKVAQRAFYKLAFHAAEIDRPLVLGLEFVDGRYQAALDAYLRGELDDAGLLHGIRYVEHQAFDVWPNFRPLLELARRLKLPVLALDHGGFGANALRRRDEYAALRIHQALGQNPKPRVLVLAGQLHVAPPHLPARVDELERAEGRAPPRSLVVYQNCEALYWQLADRGLEQRVEAVRVREGEFCLINTSPILCQRSYLDWLEGDFDGESVEPSPEPRFKEMAQLVARFVGLDAEEALDSVEVHAAGDLSFLPALPRRGYSKREIAAVKREVLSRESYYLPRAHVVYLANLSVNHAAEEATRVVRHFCAGDALLARRSRVDAFYLRCLEDALAFFGSKVVNDRRKTAHDRAWKQRLRADSLALRRVAEQVLAHRAFERGERSGVARLFREPSAQIANTVTRALGTMLGDRLYYAMLAGKIAKPELRQLFLDPLVDEGAPMEAYFLLARKLARIGVPKQH
ncbi:MAG: ChaN family lipoprotein [Deltaproteobacteria bacterium]|nr:ChaN family lipoprotein [Deltaproteobacteria bacterium]